jgi:hypothetical protein
LLHEYSAPVANLSWPAIEISRDDNKATHARAVRALHNIAKYSLSGISGCNHSGVRLSSEIAVDINAARACCTNSVVRAGD